MPKPGQVVVSVRINVKTLAEVANFLAKQGDDPKSRSHITRQAALVIREAAISEDIINRVTSAKEAVSILQGYGITFEQDSRDSEAIAKAISLEETKEPSPEDTEALEQMIREEVEKKERSSPDDLASPEDILSD